MFHGFDERLGIRETAAYFLRVMLNHLAYRPFSTRIGYFMSSQHLEQPATWRGFQSLITDLSDANMARELAHLAQSDFRARFRLNAKDREAAQTKGDALLRQHALEIITKRLAPAQIANDGHQTPMKGHPVFTAQHATACCCRTCLMKWHGITPGHALTDAEKLSQSNSSSPGSEPILPNPLSPSAPKDEKDVSPQPELF